MKKLFVLLLLGAAAAGAFVFYNAELSPPARVCKQIEQQCGAKVFTADECKAELKDASAHDIEELARCVEPSDSCLETVACLSGSVVRDVGRGFVRGLSGPR